MLNNSNRRLGTNILKGLKRQREVTCDAGNQFFCSSSRRVATKSLLQKKIKNVDIGHERELSVMLLSVIQAIRMIIM